MRVGGRSRADGVCLYVLWAPEEADEEGEQAREAA